MDLNQQKNCIRQFKNKQKREKIVFPTPRRIKREIEKLDRRAARKEAITDLRELFDRR